MLLIFFDGLLLEEVYSFSLIQSFWVLSLWAIVLIPVAKVFFRYAEKKLMQEGDLSNF